MISIYLFIISVLAAGLVLVRRRRLSFEGAAARKLARRKTVEKEVAHTEHVMTGAYSLEEKTKRLRDVMAQVIRFTRQAETAFARHEWKDAEKLLVQALSLDEFNVKANKLLGLTYLHTGQWAKAEAVFLRLSEVEREEASHFANLGLALYYQEKYEESISAYEAALARDDSKTARFVSLGQVHLKKHDIPAAIRAFEIAIQREPKVLAHHFALADAHRISGNPEAEKLIYLRILELSPYHEEAKARLADMTVIEEEVPSSTPAAEGSAHGEKEKEL